MLVPVLGIGQSTFKEQQLAYPRVAAAFAQYEGYYDSLLTVKGLKKENLRLFIRVFKDPDTLEVWASNGSQYKLLQTTAICAHSGVLGPKRKQGDRQVPEGVYKIVHFNPESWFHLSLGINYPNKADSIKGKGNKLGGDIYIHGDCISIGCLALTDSVIEPFYVLCSMAANAGNAAIPVHIFPTKLNAKNRAALKINHVDNKPLLNFWETELAPVYDYFERTKTLPNVTINAKGQYVIKE